MKFYESHYEEYISSVETINLHPELIPQFKAFPKKLNQLENMIFYGPPGVGKYSQLLYLLKRYSPSELKYDKKILAQTEKQNYTYRISDIHYEVDMSLLGCNSKLLWHEIFFQIVDIISVKPEKIGVIVCKNFHLIHTELLEIFYSYMQHYNHSHSHIQIKFFIVTEHISFLPNPIVNASHILRIGRPAKELYLELTSYYETKANTGSPPVETPTSFQQRISDYKPRVAFLGKKFMKPHPRTQEAFENIELEGILNIKETRSFPLLTSTGDMPSDVFNTICDSIIQEILSPKKLSFTNFRDTLYDILTYNLEMADCLWYMLRYFVEEGHLETQDTSDILQKTYSFLKYYNNNYRPIYHLESIMFYILNKIHKFKTT
jgi:hypothetical protein